MSVGMSGSSSNFFTVRNARLPTTTTSPSLVDVTCDPSTGLIASITSSSSSPNTSPSPSDLDASGSIVIPPLCHPHLHLDKCFLLDRCAMVDGGFAEAMSLTSSAKALFTTEDLLQRGHRLVKESIAHGVLTLRAHVEVDTTVGLICLEAGVELKRFYTDVCDIQIAVFAQDPIFSRSPTERDQMLRLLGEAAGMEGVDCVGSAPYVDRGHEGENIEFIVELARRNGLMLDFHIDYDINPDTPSNIPSILTHLLDIPPEERPHTTLGHATKLSAYPASDLASLVHTIATHALPVHFVALPTSDTYILGQTLHAPEIVAAGFGVCLGVNNVQNPFTPMGCADPMSLLPFCVNLWQSATSSRAELLMEMLSTRAVRAIGRGPGSGDEVGMGLREYFTVGREASFVVLHGVESLVEGACAAPGGERSVVRKGNIVGRRRVEMWVRV
ncbi:Metallo-dependent hydrolase [Saitoella complicata NRRL Y-17804]|uniref:Amidohydrolase-related domain-containing protein n=1 Tax=Saitoella complicata (strain BCRC 22490 / CBS 7301 / JCM 7358 / NBRC 10748 / NRRL Y-17804) TaxID=698492 RepID=A0A0E9NST6_SAICN|nr:Metallo-dependent hydrolase [Saitoella complicata NRRL Y-17804]ODQ51281.1 Metallo-dependent hydrolase [Saitoella complicata NRRL Y-17804]GAO52731.1 hypothetical protein G7K_6801-t1 [Saitoella complicata NRRL Y-17804]